MIDADNIIVQNNNLPSEIKIVNVNELSMESYDFNDEKDFGKFIQDCKRIVRRSFEYRQFINELKNKDGMNKCAFLHVSGEENPSVKIEIHHYPFTLEDIIHIVFNKRSYYHESLSVFMVAKEVMELHYKAMVGLIPLSETVHELYHNGRLFIPIDKVFGRYQLFITYYQPFIDPDLLDIIARIEKYTMENSSVGDTTIIEKNMVHYNVTDKRYILPETKKITDSMYNQIEAIKKNNYLIPSVDDIKQIEQKPYCPISFRGQNS